MSLETQLLSFAQALGADIKAVNLARGTLSSLSTDTQTDIVQAINELVTKLGTLSSLSTTDKSNIVAAINELYTSVSGLQLGSATINDAATDGDTLVTWSADKIYDSILAAKTAVKDELTNGASAALDTLSELATALGNDPDFATTIANSLGLRVAVDILQSFTEEQKTQARANISVPSNADMTNVNNALGVLDTNLLALFNSVGNTEQDLVSAYTTAKS